MQLTLDIPEKYFAYQSPTEVIQLLKLNTAIDLYKNGGMSSGAASHGLKSNSVTNLLLR